MFIHIKKMDPNLLKNLGLDSSLNQNDMQLLNQLLSSMAPGGNKKAPKMSAKDRNNLIAKLSSNTTLNEIPKKELKDMNEQEKKIYREELKQKLKNKQNELKMGRTSNLAKQQMVNNTNFTEAIGKLSEMMKDIDQSSLNPSNGMVQLENNLSNETNISQQNNTKQETLINNVFNQSNKDETNNEPENLDEYLN
jgi:hypothetical protein